MTIAHLNETRPSSWKGALQHHDETRLLRAVGLLFSLLLAYAVALAIHRIWFHPLSKYPGPLILRLTWLPAAYSNYIRGTWVRRLVKLHQKYGPAIRVGPNHISLDGSIGWPEVHGRRLAGQVEFAKTPPLELQRHNIITSPHDVHRRQRRLLSHAFSDAALVKQEAVIMRYMDMMLDIVSEASKEHRPVNIVDWFNFTAFDIIGDLVYSESFSCLENKGYHPWVLSIFLSIQGISLGLFCRDFPIIGWLLEHFSHRSMSKITTDVRSAAKDKARGRMDRGDEANGSQRDIMSYMMRTSRSGDKGMSEVEILANAPTLVIAGSETTATALSGFCFFMSRNPQAYRLLVDEIRNAFKSKDDIDMTSSGSLAYMQACINETLRFYPPVPLHPVRVSPGAMVDEIFLPAGTLVSVSQLVTFQNPSNFADPEQFIPERWLPASHARYTKRFAADNRAAFRPFGQGSRDCIGKNLAAAEMRLMICRFLYRFDFELAHAQDGWYDDQKSFLLWEKGPLYLRLRERVPES